MSFVNKTHVVFLSIGSNLGDRNQNIQVCLDKIKRIGKNHRSWIINLLPDYFRKM